MLDTATRDHLTIVALLPDYVLGKLDETSLRRVTRHLDTCPTCRRELDNAMDVLGVLAAVPPPAPWLRDSILQRAATQRPAANSQALTPASVTAGPHPSGEVGQREVIAASISAESQPSGEVGQREVIPASVTAGPHPSDEVGQRLDADADSRRRLPFGQPPPRWALVAASAAIFLVSGLGAWSYDERNAVIEDDHISALVSDPATAYPLDDSDLPVAAGGVVFAEPTGREVYLVANGLPVLPHDQRYQVWLFTTQNTQQSAGLLPAAADGEIRALLQTPGPFTDYVGVALTAEPQTGSAVPTSDMVLGGAFSPEIAALPPPLPALLIPPAGID